MMIRAQRDPDLYNAGWGPTRRWQGRVLVERAILTPRQLEVLALMAEGLTYREIAARLCISRDTVKDHQAAIYDALGPRTAAGAVAVGFRAGLIT